MTTFVKIYGSILRSSVWQQPAPTKIVWITMLALADQNGVVEASVPGLAATAGVTVEDCEAALACFLAPDKYSGSKLEDGRRIRACRGGWLIVNHSYYRELRTQKQVRDAERIAGKRARTRLGDKSPTAAAEATSRDVAPEADPDPDLDPEILMSSVSPSASPQPSSHPAGSDCRWGGHVEPLPDVTAVFACWQAEHSKQRSKLDGKRSAVIRARLAEGFSVEQLCQGIRGAKKDSFLMGQNPRAGRAFDGLETILRDAGQVERLIELDEGTAGTRDGAAEDGQWL